MFHYPHHIGDFDKATRHLTRIERSIYRDLMDLYYETETRLSNDINLICRRIIATSEEERTAVEQVLNEFFHKTPDGWYHKRCEEEIDKFHANISQKSAAGKASAEKRALKLQQAINGRSTDVQREPNGTPTNREPRTDNQEPIKDIHSPSPIGDERDPVPYEKIRELYNKNLPELRECKQLSSKRKSQIRRRWKDGMPNLETWTEFFMYVRQSDFLMGKAPPTQGRKQFEADLEWLTNESNFLKIYEGKYHG